MQWSPVSKAELPAYLKKAAALLAVATVLGGCSKPSNSEPTQTALAGEVETTAPTTTTTTSTTTTTELLQLAGEIDVSESDIAVTSSDS